MDETCHKAQEIDLALFLIEPHGSQWQEFRVHYPYCATCSAELQKWTSLEHGLRAVGNSSAAIHPSAEALVKFQQRANLLPAEERSKIDVHLRSCTACREEVNLLGSFDFSLVPEWAGETPAVAPAETHVSWSGRVWNALRSLFLHPAFAYGLVLLLSVPFIRSYYSSSFNQTPTSTDVGSTSVPISERGKAELKQEQESPVGEMQATRTLPQVTASAPTRLQPPSEKTKEDGPPTKLAKQSARREDFALKDERVPVPPPTSPAPSIAASARARDAEVPARQKSPLPRKKNHRRSLNLRCLLLLWKGKLVVLNH